MILTGQPVDTTSALRHGLVDQVVPFAALDATIDAEITRLLALPNPPRTRPGPARANFSIAD